ncbi:MAG: FAD-dependent oxidoreductase [Gemmatimonadota bacterium]
MTATPEVVIVGGGAVGAACARELSRAGRSVLVVDRGDRVGEGWRASAGLLAPQIDASEGDPLFELSVAGREYFRGAAPELLDTTRIDVELYDRGVTRLAHGETEVDRLKESLAWQRQQGHRTEWLDPAELKSEWPWLAPADGALFAPHDGSVDPTRLVEALRADAERLGARFVSDTVNRIETVDGRVVAAVGASRHKGAEFVLAAGAWSGRLAGLPRPVSVEPVKGQMAALPWPTNVPPVVVYGTGVYVLHRRGEALVGATKEHAGFSIAVSDEATTGLVACGRSLLPGLGSLAVTRSWAGLRPGTPDGLPIVGREPSVRGLWYATGHGRNGILLAGITGIVLGHLMAGEATFEDIEVMRPERFWSW